MKRLLNILLIILLTGAGIYLVYSCYVSIDEGSLGLVEDKQTGEYEELLDSGNHLVLKNVLPDRLAVHRINSICNDQLALIIYMPSLVDLQNDAYAVKITVSAGYEIVPEQVAFNMNELLRDEGFLRKEISRRLEVKFQGILGKYLAPQYRPEQIKEFLAGNDTVVKGVFSDLCREMGLTYKSFSIEGVPIVPSLAIWNDGERSYGEFRQLRDKARRNEEDNRYRLANQNLEQNAYYDHLRMMSSIIQSNPEILKYIYIDKISKINSVNLSVAGNPFPLWLDKSNPLQQSGASKGNIDNFHE